MSDADVSKREVSDHRGWVLTICAASRGWNGDEVCGLNPGHTGPHQDIEYGARWPQDESVKAATDA